jgi:hypothetical protein
MCITHTVFADTLTLVTDSSLLSANDFIDWGTLGPALTVVPNPVSASSIGGNAVTASMPTGAFERVDQGTGWNGNFLVSDHLLWTMDSPGPIALGFAVPLAAAGAGIQAEFFGAFQATLTAFNGSGILGTVSVTADSNSNADGSAPFLGVIDDTGRNITSVQYSVTSETRVNTFAIDTLKLGTQVPPVPVPEPSSLLLLSSGFVTFVLTYTLFLRRSSRSRTPDC